MQMKPCAECGGTMQMGYVMDRGETALHAQTFWVEGEPEYVKVLGMKAALTIKDRARYEIVTLRCEQCGLLRSYARPEDRCG